MRRQAGLVAPVTTSFLDVRTLDGTGIAHAPLDRPQETLSRPFVMRDGKPFGPFHLTPGKRLSDPPMILGDPIEATRKEHADVAEPLARIVEILEQRGKTRRMGRPPDELVKFAVGAEDFLEVFGLHGTGHLTQDGAYAVMILWREMGCRQASRQAVQDPPDVIQLDDLAR